MRTGGVRNPYDNILQNIGARQRKKSSVHRFPNSEGEREPDEYLQGQAIDGGHKIQWNHQESSSPKRDIDARIVNVMDADAVSMELNGDQADLGISGKGARGANQCAVSSKQKSPAADGEGSTAYENVTSPTRAYGSDCGGEGEKERPAGWSVMNTKAKRTELTQSDEEQMLQLSQESRVQEGKETERPFSPAASNMDGTPPKLRKRQNSGIRKRPRGAPGQNPLARDIMELLQSGSGSEPFTDKYFAEPRTKKTKEIEGRNAWAPLASEEQEDHPCPEINRDAKRNRNSDTSLEEDDIMEDHEPSDLDDAKQEPSPSDPLKNVVITVRCKCPSQCKHIPSRRIREQRFGGGFSGYESSPQTSSSKSPRPQGRRNERPAKDAKLEHDANREGKDTFRGTALHKTRSMRNVKETQCAKMNKKGQRMNVISSMHDVSFPTESQATNGDCIHVEELPQGEGGSHNHQVLNSNSDESWTSGPLLPSGEDGYSFTREGVNIGLQVRQQLLGRSKGYHNDFPPSTAARKPSVCQNTAGPVTSRGEQHFQPDHEDKRRSPQNATSVVQPIERDADMKPNLNNAQLVEITSPSPWKRQIRRRNRKASLTGRKEPLPEEHYNVTQKASQAKKKPDMDESITHIISTQSPTEAKHPSHPARHSDKEDRRGSFDIPSGALQRQTKEGSGIADGTDHVVELDGEENGHARRQNAKGTETKSNQKRSPEESHRENRVIRTLNYSQEPRASNVSDSECADGSESHVLEAVRIISEQSTLLTDEANRGGAIHPAARKLPTTPGRQDHVSDGEVEIKPNLDESIVDVDDYTAEKEKTKEMQASQKSKRENLKDLVDDEELNKQSRLLLRRSTRLRYSRSDGARHRRSTRALDDLSDNEGSNDHTHRSAVPSSRPRSRSSSTQAAGVEREKIHSMITRRTASRLSDTGHRSGAVIDLTGSEDDGKAATISRAVEDSVDEALRELQKSSIKDREKAYYERPRCKYLTPLSNDENRLVRHLFTRTKRDTRIVTIAEAKITIFGENIKRLRGTRWLDDEVLNAYMSLINSRNDAVFHELSDEHRSGIPRTYVFSTFFFRRLHSESSGFDYPGVQRWTRTMKGAKIDILEKDLILVPVNLGNHHWVLSGIDMEHREMLYLDSMHGPDTAKVIPKLKRWVFEELCIKHGESVALRYDPKSWKVAKHSYRIRRTGVLPDTLDSHEAKSGRMEKVPKQRDGGSCGVFTAKMADCLSLGIKIYFKQGDIPLVRRRMAVDLFSGYLPL